MVRDAIVEVLSGIAGLDGRRTPDVRVEGACVRVELTVPARSPSMAAAVAEIDRRLWSLPEVAHSHVVVVIDPGVSP